MASIKSIKLDSILKKAADREEVIQNLTEELGKQFDFAAVFVVKGGAAILKSTSQPRDIAKFGERAEISLEKEGMLQTAWKTGSSYYAPPGKSQSDRHLFRILEVKPPRFCGIFPVILKNRPVLLLYLSNGEQEIAAQKITEINLLCDKISKKLQELIIQKKKTAASPHKKEKTKDVAKEEEPLAINFNNKPLKAGRYQMTDLEHTPLSKRFQSKVPEKVEEKKKEPSQPAVRKILPKFIRGEETPTAPTASKASASLKKEITSEPVEETVTSSNGKEKKEVVSVVLKEETVLEKEDLSLKKRKVQEDPSMLPPGTFDFPESGAGKEKEEELDDLIEKIIKTDLLDELSRELLHSRGEVALQKLIDHFPGPIKVDRYQPAECPKKVEQHGIVLLAIRGFGKKAIPHLLPLLSHLDSEVRFYATFLLVDIIFGSGTEFPLDPRHRKVRRALRERCLEWWEKEGKSFHPLLKRGDV